MGITRFLVITAALVITLGLGYLRFVRRAGPAAAAGPAAEGLSEIEARVRRLEARMNDAARALRSTPDA